jgi:hypothetical protein
MEHLFAFLVVFCAGLIYYSLTSPEMRMEVKAPDEMIQRCISDAWKMQYEINESTSMAELQAWYWEVEHFESCYTNLVPDSLIKQQSDRLYDAVTLRRDAISGIVAA